MKKFMALAVCASLVVASSASAMDDIDPSGSGRPSSSGRPSFFKGAKRTARAYGCTFLADPYVQAGIAGAASAGMQQRGWLSEQSAQRVALAGAAAPEAYRQRKAVYTFGSIYKKLASISAVASQGLFGEGVRQFFHNAWNNGISHSVSYDLVTLFALSAGTAAAANRLNVLQKETNAAYTNDKA